MTIHAALALALMLVPVEPATAQGVSAHELKAAFVFNFAKFAEWPSLSTGKAIRMCVFGDDRLATALSQTVHDQTVDGHGLSIARVSPDTIPTSCEVLFLAGAEQRNFAALLASAAPLPILTVSDATHFVRQGGMVELFMENGRMRFAVNVDTVQRSHVHISSRLLSLAKIVRDGDAQ